MKNIYLASVNPMHFSHWHTLVEAETRIKEKVFLCICRNDLKDAGLFTLEERAEIAHKLYFVPKEQIVLLSDKESIVRAIENATVIVRGIRSEKDFFEIERLIEHYGVSNDCKKLLPINVPDSMKMISSSLLIERIKFGTYTAADNWVPENLVSLIKERLVIHPQR